MKSVKVFYLGRRMRDVYPHATRWQVFKWKTMQFVRKCVIGGIMVGTLLGAYVLGSFGTTIEYVKGATVDSMPLKVGKIKHDLVYSLALQCETIGYKNGDDAIIMDTNNRLSVGPWKFQIATVQHYEKLLYNRDVTREEAVKIAMDEKQAYQLTEDIIFKTDNVEREWTNCTHRLGLAEKVAYIKQIEK